MNKRIAFAVGLGLGLTLGLLWVVSGGMGVQAAPAAELYVCPSGCAYTSIQAAVDAANDGDTIKVAQGTYTDIHARTGITQVVYIDKSVSIRGGYAPSNWSVSDPAAHPTILDAGGKGRGVYVTGYNDITIQDLRVTGGDAAGLGGDPWGGDAGGGVFVNVSPAHLRNLLITHNKAYRGGGLFLSVASSVIEECEIISNTADSGGGGYIYGGHDRLERNIIRANKSAWGGGGLFLSGSYGTLINNAITDNQAGTDEGSGMFFYNGAPSVLYATITNNPGKSGVFVDNNGLPPGTTVAMTNTIISGHTVGVKLSGRQRNTVTLTTTLWHDNTTNWSSGAGVIQHANDYFGDPAFAADGYHLTSNSAAINKGIDSGVHNDIDGEVRPWGGGYDIGADEFGSSKPRHLYLPLTLHKR